MMDTNENKQMADYSGSTGSSTPGSSSSSTGDSTAPVVPVQRGFPLEWSSKELQKMNKKYMVYLIYFFYELTRGGKKKSNQNEVNFAHLFFKIFFPGRTPRGTYDKCSKLNKK